MWKDKGLQLVMLPTTNSSNLGLYIDTKNIVLRKQSDIPRGESQYLYLLSDEEIKEGEIVLTDENSIERATGLYGNFPCDLINEVGGQRKVIAATDPSLNLPQFPSSFLEEYVKRYNSKKSLEVEVAQPIRTEKICQNCIDYKSSYHCEICNSNLDMFKNVIDTISIRFKEEKMYNRSEVEKLCGNAFDAGEAYRTGSCEGFKQIHPNKHDWIKENLK